MKKVGLLVVFVVFALVSAGCLEPFTELNTIDNAHSQINNLNNPNNNITGKNPMKIYQGGGIGFYPSEESEYYGKDLTLFLKNVYYSGKEGAYVADWEIDYEGEIITSFVETKVGDNLKTITYPFLAYNAEIVKIDLNKNYYGREEWYAIVEK